MKTKQLWRLNDVQLNHYRFKQILGELVKEEKCNTARTYRPPDHNLIIYSELRNKPINLQLNDMKEYDTRLTEAKKPPKVVCKTPRCNLGKSQNSKKISTPQAVTKTGHFSYDLKKIKENLNTFKDVTKSLNKNDKNHSTEGLQVKGPNNVYTGDKLFQSEATQAKLRNDIVQNMFDLSKIKKTMEETSRNSEKIRLKNHLKEVSLRYQRIPSKFKKIPLLNAEDQILHTLNNKGNKILESLYSTLPTFQSEQVLSQANENIIIHDEAPVESLAVETPLQQRRERSTLAFQTLTDLRNSTKLKIPFKRDSIWKKRNNTIIFSSNELKEFKKELIELDKAYLPKKHKVTLDIVRIDHTRHGKRESVLTRDNRSMTRLTPKASVDKSCYSYGRSDSMKPHLRTDVAEENSKAKNKIDAVYGKEYKKLMKRLDKERQRYLNNNVLKLNDINKIIESKKAVDLEKL